MISKISKQFSPPRLSLLSLGLFLFSLLSLLPLSLLLFSQVCQVFPLSPVGATLIQHGSHARHHLAQQLIAGNADTTEKSNLKTDFDKVTKVVGDIWINDQRMKLH